MLQMTLGEMPEMRVNGSKPEKVETAETVDTEGQAAEVAPAVDEGQAVAVATPETVAPVEPVAPVVEDSPAPPVPPRAVVGEPRWSVVLRWLAVIVVAAAAAVASTDHLAEVARLAGTEGFKVWLLPASVDGLAVAAGLALHRAHHLGRRPGVVPWVCEVSALAASVAGNVVAVYPELVDVAVLKVAVGAVPPLALAAVLKLALAQGGDH